MNLKSKKCQAKQTKPVGHHKENIFTQEIPKKYQAKQTKLGNMLLKPIGQIGHEDVANLTRSLPLCYSLASLIDEIPHTKRERSLNRKIYI